MHYLSHNGVKLSYTVAGRGAPPLLLVHGWCDNHTRLAAMAAHFRRQHQVVSVDVRGHGASDKPQADYAIATFAEDLAWMCRQLDIEKPIVIGHSLGGSIALELSARHPDLLAAVVAVEGLICTPEPIRAGGQELLEALRSPAWREAMHGFVDGGFLPTDDPELRRKAHAELEQLPQYLHISVAEQMLAWDAAQAARGCKVPLLYIEGGSGLSDLEQLQTLCPQLVVGKTVGVGHNQMVATPQQVNAMIERFIVVALHNPRSSASTNTTAFATP
ncbi:MAG: alpha/beta hydrolase [Chloroflexaceae bacterium]|jgi:pimeloyl-ACP methyl ester carboxylesterase|nr:alpha/beta hydrolase [Chloroflexaceae bacterium]